jgi:hypothetical protein
MKQSPNPQFLRLLFGGMLLVAGAVVQSAHAAKPADFTDILGSWTRTPLPPRPLGVMQINVTASSSGRSLKVDAVLGNGELLIDLGKVAAAPFATDPSSDQAESWSATYWLNSMQVRFTAVRLSALNGVVGDYLQVIEQTTYPKADISENTEQTVTLERSVAPSGQ